MIVIITIPFFKNKVTLIFFVTIFLSRYYSSMAIMDPENLYFKLNRVIDDFGLECYPFKV